MNTSAIWTKDFILNCIVCFVVNQSYYMTMVVIADYAATALHASLAEAGLACGIFILGTLFARLFLGGCIERIGLKRSLYIGLFLFLAASLLNIGIHSLYPLYAARFVQGVGFGLSSSTTGTVMAHLVPAARRGEGTSYYAMFVTLGTAVGPFAGLYFYSDGVILYNLVAGSALLILAFAATALLHVPAEDHEPSVSEQPRSYLSLQNFIEPTALPVAFLTLLVNLGFAAILGFMASFAKEADLLASSKYFFLVYALVTVCSRPFTGRWFDSRGANFVMYPAFIFFALSLCFISLSTSGWMLLGAAALMGLGYGTYMSCSQAIIIGLAPRGRMGLATSTFFVFMDLSVGAGPLVLGALLPYAGFRVMYAALAVLLACCAVLYYVLYGQNAAKQKLASK